MNAQLTNTTLVDDYYDDRPTVYFAMGSEDLRALRAWAKTQPAPDLQSPILANKYRCGAQGGLTAVGLGFGFLYPGAEPLERAWTDATGTVWRWDDDEMLGVARHIDGTQVELAGDSRDYVDYPDEEMAAFASGMLDGIIACGWTA